MSYTARSCGRTDMNAVKERPSMEEWFREACETDQDGRTGIYLFYNGIVKHRHCDHSDRAEGFRNIRSFSQRYDRFKAEAAVVDTYRMQGITHVRIWINDGVLTPGDRTMLVMVGGDSQENAGNGLSYLTRILETECISSEESM